MKYLLDMDDVRSCRAELERSADLTQYTTSYAADDLNDVRAALGYDEMALFGGSYGTRLGLETMRRHPNRVELAVLMAVAPPSMLAPAGFARSQQAALDRLIELCSAIPAAGTPIPGSPNSSLRCSSGFRTSPRPPASLIQPSIGRKR